MTNSAKTSLGIPKGWEKTSVGDFCPFVYGEGLPATKRKEGNIKVFGSNGVVGLHNQALINESGIIIGRKGTIGIAHFSKTPFWPIDTTFYVKNAKHRDLRFTYYLLNSLGLDTMNSDSAVPGLNRNAAHSYQILIPPLHEQKLIACILGTLDDKIELNHRINETLEMMSQTLFKDWFVNFGPTRAKMSNCPPYLAREIWDLFPNKLDNEGNPQGWKMSTIGEHVTRLMVKNRYKKNDVVTYGNVPVFEQGANVVMGYHNEVPDIEASLEQPKFIFGGHTCVTKLSAEPFSISDNVVALDGKNHSTYWVYYAIQGKQSFEEYKWHWIDFIAKPLLLPSRKLTDAFSKIVRHNIEKSEQIRRESLTLCQIRDMLIPKLISGKVRAS